MNSEFVFEKPVSFESKGQRKSRSFVVSVGTTLVIGVGLAVLAIWCFRPAKQIVKVTETIMEPALPPIIKEVIKEVVKEVPAPPPPVLESPAVKDPPVMQAAHSPVKVLHEWEGIWRPKRSTLPMFKLMESGGTVSGIYVPPNGTVLPFRGGSSLGDAVEVVVDDSLFRVHFRLTSVDSSSMKVEAWITDEDWLISLDRGNKMVRTPQAALVVRLQLAQNIRMTRKPMVLGTFYRGTEN